MRALTAVLSASAASLAWAALEAPVYFFDKSPQASNAGNTLPSTSLQAARLLLAQRLGLSEYHNIKDADEQTLQALNQFRDTQTPLFSSKTGANEIGKLMVVVEGLEKPEDIFEKMETPAFRISNPPTSSSNIQLVTDLLDQDRHRRGALKSCTDEISSSFVSTSIQGRFSGNDPFGGS